MAERELTPEMTPEEKAAQEKRLEAISEHVRRYYRGKPKPDMSGRKPLTEEQKKAQMDLLKDMSRRGELIKIIKENSEDLDDDW